MKPRTDLWNTPPWRTVPRDMWAIVRNYIGSNAPADIERAHTLCREYGLNYDEMRRVIDAEMIEYERARMAALLAQPAGAARML